MKIWIDKSNRCRGKESIYFTTPGHEVTSLLDAIHPKYYDARLRAFETSLSNFDTLLDTFIEYDIEIPENLPKKLENKLIRLGNFDVTTEPVYVTEPFAHQVACVEYAKSHPKFLIGDDMGLGKTKQAIDIAVMRKEQCGHCLIVCGVNNLKFNWRDEIKIHSNEDCFILGERLRKSGKEYIGGNKEKLEDLNKLSELPYFIITNIEALRNKEIGAEIKKLCDKDVIGMTIIDEIHKAKSPTTQQGKAIHKCTSYYRLALTGTPLINTPIDLYNILKWLDVVNVTLDTFKSRYCIMGGFGDYQIVDYKNLDILTKQLKGIMIRRMKTDVVDLPPKVNTYELLEMDTKQAKLYDDVKQQFVDNIDKVMLSSNPLAELIRLRQCTGATSILSSDINESVKIDRCYEIVEELASQGRKCIVFSNWTSITDIAYSVLSDFNPSLVTGEIDEVESQIKKFKEDATCMCIVGTIGVLGTGFTLTEADTVIFLDEPYSYANKGQAEDRAYRIGTKSTVNIITLLCKGTIDERIAEIVRSKKELSDMIVDGKGERTNKNTIEYLLS